MRDTGITVAEVIRLLASGASNERVFESFPSLEIEDIEAAKTFLRAIVSTTRATRDLGIRRQDLVEILSSPHIGLPRPSRPSRTKEPSTRTKQHIEALFAPSERAAAERLLADLVPLST